VVPGAGRGVLRRSPCPHRAPPRRHGARPRARRGGVRPVPPGAHRHDAAAALPAPAGRAGRGRVGRGRPHRLGRRHSARAGRRRGVQVLDRDTTTWVDVPPVPGAFVVNIGDLMARWTNDRFRSTVHRVVPPDGRDRFSVVFFMDLDHHATIEVLPTCVPAGEQPRYGPTTAGEHLLRSSGNRCPPSTAPDPPAAARRRSGSRPRRTGRASGTRRWPTSRPTSRQSSRRSTSSGTPRPPRSRPWRSRSRSRTSG
jgi:2OG-Fe(II) oxygenase superfamily